MTTGTNRHILGPDLSIFLIFLYHSLITLASMVLQPYVEDLFKDIFAMPTPQCATVPKAVKFLFDFLDHRAAEIGVQDSDTVHRWKTML